jgi:hypothetical protein
MVDMTRQSGLRTHRPRPASLEYQLYFGVTFLILLPVFIAARLLPRRWHPLPSIRDAGKSPFGEARMAASMVVPFVFMG